MNIDTFRNPLLFRKDGKLTMQPRKVSYDLDGNAEIDKSDPEVRISISKRGFSLDGLKSKNLMPLSLYR